MNDFRELGQDLRRQLAREYIRHGESLEKILSGLVSASVPKTHPIWEIAPIIEAQILGAMETAKAIVPQGMPDPPDAVDAETMLH